MYSKFFAAAAIALCLSVAGCGGITDPSQNTTEPFSGVINHGDPIHFFPFNTAKTGEVSAKFTSLTPVSNAIVQILVTQANGDGGCTGDLGLVTPQLPAQLNVSVFLGQLQSRRYCLGVLEGTPLTQAESYTVALSHP
jgi:hypothetical protein